LNAISDSVSDLASFNDGADGADEDDDEEEPELGKLSEDDGPSWVRGIISKMAEYWMKHLWPKQIMLDELTLPDWGDAADYLHERDKKYGMTELKVPMVFQQQTEDNAAPSGLRTVGESMETLDSIPGKLQMPQLTSPPGSCHMRLGYRKPQTHKVISSLLPDATANVSPIPKSIPVEPISFYPGM